MDTDSNGIAMADKRDWERVAMSLALASRFIILPNLNKAEEAGIHF